MIGLIDIGGTKILAGVAIGGGVQAVIRRPTTADDPLGTLSSMLREAGGGGTLEAIAMAVPGPFDRAAGALVNPPGMPPSWWNQPLAEGLSQQFGCPVWVENDANCAALAEAHHGAGRGHDLIVYYTVSTGIGTGIVHRGVLLTGRHDNEGGHQILAPEWMGGPPCHCGGHGCLEALASGLALQQRHGRPAEELDAQEIWDEEGRWLGLAVVNATALLDCDAVIFGGGVCAQWERFAPELHRTVAGHLFLQPAPAVLRAELGDDRNLWGALHLVGTKR